MPEVLVPVKLTGQKGTCKVKMLANSGSNIVVIPPELAEKIGAKVLDKEELIEVGGGILIKGYQL